MIAYDKSRVEAPTRKIYGLFHLFSSTGNSWVFNLRLGGTIRWKAEERWLGRSGSVLWQAVTSKIVVLACVGYGPMG
jgi:hypothetical protein